MLITFLFALEKNQENKIEFLDQVLMKCFWKLEL